MANRTKDPIETTVIKRDPASRKAAVPRTSRKARPAATEHAEQTGNLESEPEGMGAGSTPTHDQIARRAHELYLRRGSRNGHDFDDWLEAERQLRGGGTR